MEYEWGKVGEKVLRQSKSKIVYGNVYETTESAEGRVLGVTSDEEK